MWSFLKNLPGFLSSIRIISLREVPIIEDQIPRMKYRVPISLWLVENSHRFIKVYYF